MIGERVCTLPHHALSDIEERIITNAVKAWQPWIVRLAKRMAKGDDILAEEMESHALSQLWEIGAAALTSMPEEHVSQVLRLKMKSARIIAERGAFRVRAPSKPATTVSGRKAS